MRAGDVIALPTDTLYGLAADAGSDAAIDALYAAKGRDRTNPLAICVGELAHVPRYCETAHLPAGALDALLPGAVTVLLPRKRGAGVPLATGLNPGVSGVGVRVPADGSFARDVCAALGNDGALALTSANASGAPSTTRVREFAHLWGACAAVYDGGTTSDSRAGSTVVDLQSEGSFQLLREGMAADAVRAALASRGLEERA